MGTTYFNNPLCLIPQSNKFLKSEQVIIFHNYMTATHHHHMGTSPLCWTSAIQGPYWALKKHF